MCWLVRQWDARRIKMSSPHCPAVQNFIGKLNEREIELSTSREECRVTKEVVENLKAQVRGHVRKGGARSGSLESLTPLLCPCVAVG